MEEAAARRAAALTERHLLRSIHPDLNLPVHRLEVQ